MKQNIVTRDVLVNFIHRLDAVFARPASLFMIGETTQVFEGMRTWATNLEFTSSLKPADRDLFGAVMRDVACELGVTVLDQSPGDLIPLPEGYPERMRSVVGLALKQLTLVHFDPYSVSFRFIARGDEPDYQVVLTFLKNGWIDLDEMDEMLKALLPRFSMATIQQDPAEFRRKYKSLGQMWRSARPHATHRTTVV